MTYKKNDYFKESKVINESLLYIVELGGYSFFINKNAVEKVISEIEDETPNNIAILLAYIKYAKVLSNSEKDIKNEDLITFVSKVLKHYSKQQIIDTLSKLSWKEIYEIISSASPEIKVAQLI